MANEIRIRNSNGALCVEGIKEAITKDVAFKLLNPNEKSNKNKTDLCNDIASEFDYETLRKKLREIYRDSDKYKNCKDSLNRYKEFDKNFKKSLESLNLSFEDVMDAENVGMYNLDSMSTLAIRNGYNDPRTIGNTVKTFLKTEYFKAKSTFLNDYIEYLMFEYIEDLIPTFGNKKGVDYFIGGIGFDQKCSSSVGKAFIKNFCKDSPNWEEIAYKNPKNVAISLYQNQGNDRFDASPRVFIINSDIKSIDRLEEKIKDMKFDSPYEIKFIYKKSEYDTKCFVFFI